MIYGFDIETYHDNFYAGIQEKETGRTFGFNSPAKTIAWLQSLTAEDEVWTFNGIHFDINIFYIMLSQDREQTVESAKEISDEIIRYKQHSMWPPIAIEEFRKYFSFTLVDWKALLNIDAALKQVLGYLGYKKIQDLPLRPDALYGFHYDDGDWKEVEDYCHVDVAGTLFLGETFIGELESRKFLGKEYNLNITTLSRSDAGHVFFTELPERAIGDRVKAEPVLKAYSFGAIISRHLVPQLSSAGVKLSDEIRAALKAMAQTTRQAEDQRFAYEFSFRGVDYVLGEGGLHGATDPGIYRRNDTHRYFYLDANSYYPFLFANYSQHRNIPADITQATPRQLVYQTLVDVTLRRIEAKQNIGKDPKAKVLADSLKIFINALTGKLGKPEGQLGDKIDHNAVLSMGQALLLVLIDGFSRVGMRIIHANTDGVCVEVPVDLVDKIDAGMKWWESIASPPDSKYPITLGKDELEVFAMINVNSYMYQTTSGKVTVKKDMAEKGALSSASLVFPIIGRCLQQYVLHGKTPEEVVNEATDIRDFVILSRAKRGTKVFYAGEEIGDGSTATTLRYYVRKMFSDDGSGIPAMPLERQYGTARRKMPHASNVSLLLDIENEHVAAHPALDKQFYINLAKKRLKTLNVRLDSISLFNH